MSNTDFSTSFKEAYNHLNVRQKVAVDAINGPVLVLAGPGTGKTELLAVRAGNILNQGIDIRPHNILCLTFTDAGTYAMRSRLLKYIGPAAYNVAIHTYHSFCNQVIRENMEEFGSYRDLQAVSDLEKVEIIRDLLDDLSDDNILKRLKGNIYYDRKNVVDLFETMKKENWTTEDFSTATEAQKALLLEDPNMYYKRKSGENKKGDLKEKTFNKEIERYEKTLAAAQLLPVYNHHLKKKERFDFQDMILWVLDKFDKNEVLLSNYQERFQFILLDEYQDTNGSQNELVFKLSAYWEDPNLFAVGDDDQSIYRFQGANMNNITDFVDRFNPQVVVLEQNYRSDQKILDAATQVINYNKERIVHRNSDLTKNLIASRKDPGYPILPPEIKTYRNPDQEEVGLIESINKLISNGLAYKDIAIIYRNHSAVEKIVKYLTRHKVPLNIRKKVNVLQLPAIRQLVNILQYIHGEFQKPHSESRRLFEILHYPFLGLKPIDLARISVYCSVYTDQTEDDRYWREVIQNPDLLSSLKLKDAEKIEAIANMLESWIALSVTDTPQVLIEKIITGSHWLQHLLHSDDRTFLLQAFNTFLNLVKDDSARMTEYTLTTLLENLNKMSESGLELSLMQSIHHEEGIHFVTAHSSKGLEFKHVFIIKVLSKSWVEKNRSRGFKLPEMLVPSSAESDIEDDRRLFFVAMTRAEEGLHISYSVTDHNDKEVEPAVFVYESEIPIPDEVRKVEEEKVAQYLIDTMTYQAGLQPIIDSQLVNEVLKKFKFSATALNKYLKCPLTFYFENVLRVPMARTTAMGFGNAIHLALEMYFRSLNENLTENKSVPSKADLLGYFNKGMERYHSHFTTLEYQNYHTHGNKVLGEYYDHYHNQWNLPREYKLEYVVDDVSVEGIPIKGKLDKLIFYDDQLEVVDYKTGRFKAAKLKPPLGPEDNGGDYWRQLTFYKLLIDNDPKRTFKFTSGTMDFVEQSNDQFYRRNKVISKLDTELVTDQIKESYNRLKDHDFTGCGEDNCKWCTFTNENGDLAFPLENEEKEREDD